MTPASSAPTHPATATPSHWVLVVDDEDPIRQLITEALKGEGVEVRHATGGEEGLRQIAAAPTEPLLVLADVVMPGMDGLTFARELERRLKHSRVALMSGKLADVSWWPTDLREVSFLPKPIELAALFRLVNEARLYFPGPK